MSIGNYLSEKAHKEPIEKGRRKVESSIDNLSDEETEEIREIFKKDDLLKDLVKVITSKRKIIW